MEKKSFIEKLLVLLANEDVLSVAREVNELRTRFEDFCIEEDRKKQVAFLEAQERGEEVEYSNEPDLLKEEFYALFNDFKEKRIKVSTEIKIKQEANLRNKKAILEKLKNLIDHEENIGIAVETYKALHEEWKIIGDIPRETRQDVQSEYSKLLESFFFNLKIYRELKEHDLKRNFQLKQEVVAKIQQLDATGTVKDMEAQIKVYQNEFDEIGPVPKDEWDNVKNAYWTSVKSVYHKINQFYEAKREEKKLNLEKKHALLIEVKTFMQTIEIAKDVKTWDQLTHQLLNFQETWKGIGMGSKKENEELWGEFRNECDTFFTKKKAYFDVIRTQYDKVTAQKQALIQQVNGLKESEEWKNTTEKIIRIQQEWKKLGSAGQKNEQRLWKEFRAVCDFFFDAKKTHFEKEDADNDANLKAKQALNEEIAAYIVSDDKSKVIEDLKAFTHRFNEIGKVPFKEKDDVYKVFKAAIDAHYSKIKLEGAEREKVLFEAHIEQLKSNPNAGKLIEKERRDLEQSIAKIQQDINQLENNLGFISKSKSGDALKKDVESKIEASKRRIKEYKTKIRLLSE
jgi:hypothetical protein